MLMIGKASMMLDWDHMVTDKSEVIKVFATIFPMVSSLTQHWYHILTGYRMTVSSPSRTEHDNQGLLITFLGAVLRTFLAIPAFASVVWSSKHWFLRQG
jgi:hypothetical protein